MEGRKSNNAPKRGGPQARSGSTEFGLTLNAVESEVYGIPAAFYFLPIRWMWDLLGATVGRVLTLDRLEELVVQDMPAGMLQRHRPKLSMPDTFEPIYSMWTFALGPGAPDVMLGTLEDVYGLRPGCVDADVEQFCDFVDNLYYSL